MTDELLYGKTAYVENHDQRSQAHNIESSDEECGRWGGITTIVYIYDD